MSEAYSWFAFAYDQALGTNFHSGLVQLLDLVVPRLEIRDRSHLDIACGTGMALHYFRRKRFRSIGVDASLPMLQLAKSRERRLVAGDFRALPFRKTFGLITSFYDSLNHLLEPEDLARTFSEIRELMSPDSFFLFDVNHPDAYPRVWGLPEPYVSKGRDHVLSIDTRFSNESGIGEATVTGWARVGGEKVEIEEVHRQRSYSQATVEKLLRESGFEISDVVQFDPFALNVLKGDVVKLFFVARAR